MLLIPPPPPLPPPLLYEDERFLDPENMGKGSLVGGGYPYDGDILPPPPACIGEPLNLLPKMGETSLSMASLGLAFL